MAQRIRQGADGQIRLDLGSGPKRFEGWVSVDLATERRSRRDFDDKYEFKPDYVADIRKLPFPDDWADEARAIHVIEHFYPWEVPAIIDEWVRVLRPGGKLAIECPCMDKVIRLALVPRIHPQYVYWALYGDPRYKEEAMMHHWCYSEGQLEQAFINAGMVDIRLVSAVFHEPIRDMRIVGRKPLRESVLVAP